jgi:hypothetical protein
MFNYPFNPKSRKKLTSVQTDLKKNYISSHQKADMSESTWNWVYNTCNGYRDMNPTGIEFVELEGKRSIIAASFSHIITLWDYEPVEGGGGGISFIDDLVNCDASNAIRQVKHVAGNYLLVAYKNSADLWKVSCGGERNESGRVIESELAAASGGRLNTHCVWSSDRLLDEEIVQVETGRSNEQLVLFMRQQKKSGAESAHDNGADAKTILKSNTFNLN